MPVVWTWDKVSCGQRLAFAVVRCLTLLEDVILMSGAEYQRW